MVQYCHSKTRYNEASKLYKTKTGTIAVQMPSKKQMFEAMQMQATAFLLPVGVSVLSYEDNFCKATGRQVAESKMQPTLCEINSIEVRRQGTRNKYVYHLTCAIKDPKKSNRKIHVHFGIATTHDSEESRLCYVDYT